MRVFYCISLGVLNCFTVFFSLKFWAFTCNLFENIFWNWFLFITVASWIVILPHFLINLAIVWFYTSFLIKYQTKNFSIMSDTVNIFGLSILASYYWIWGSYGYIGNQTLYPTAFKILSSIFITIIFYQYAKRSVPQ